MPLEKRLKADAAAAHLNFTSRALDKKYVWHPFTQMSDWLKEDNLAIESGRGVYLEDSEGKKYIDGVSSLWVNVHGHRKNRIDRAIKNQLAKIAHSTYLGLAHAPGSMLAARLVSLAPAGLTKVFYSDSGSTAVEIALKMAFQYWRQKKNPAPAKTKFLSLKNAYHGDTIGSVSVGGMDLFHAKFQPLLFKSFFAPSPYCYRCPHRKKSAPAPAQNTRNSKFGSYCRSVGCRGECLLAAKKILKKHSRKIAAAVVEPMIQCAAGMLTMPPGYLSGFANLCRKHKALLIADEVATGFGRTGKMFACEIENIRPDLMCLAKGITGGYLPLAATLATEKIYRSFLGRYEDFRTFFHGHTYTANPLACAAAIANLDIFRREKTLDALPPKIKTLSAGLQKLSMESPFIGDVRQIGLMAGIEIVKEKETGEMFEPKEKIAVKICRRARDYGVILRPLGNVVVIMPPLSSSEGEIKKILAAVENSVRDIVAVPHFHTLPLRAPMSIGAK
ncbi:MAG: adenosylmethionine--8-amino-7-oxononanoate transaminase [Endomicrobiia bacterium]|nr:adenosylmethionine--8-amino-7-oxononanoate transaminase [Endomicrobiia bacterium]